MYKAKFKTAHDLREIPVEVAVVGSADLTVGELVTFVAASGNNPAYISSAASVAAATHVVAQSDMTMEYGHVPVENRDYKYSPKVAKTAATISASAPTKKVALFEAVKEDLIVTQVS